MSSPEPVLVALMVTYRRPEVCLSTLRLLWMQTRRPNILVVVDNDPAFPYQLENEIKRIVSDAIYIPSKVNLGPAGGIAVGVDKIIQVMEKQDFRLLLIDDDDPPVRNYSVEALLDLMDAMQFLDAATVGVGLIGGRLQGRRIPKLRNLARGSEGEGIRTVDWINGGYLPIYQRRAFEVTGGFKPELFFGFEELEFGLHLKRLGFSLYADLSLWKEHASGYSKPARLTSRRLKSDRLSPSWRTYWTTRNLHWVLSHHGYYISAWYYSVRRVLGRVSILHPLGSIRSLVLITRAIMDGSHRQPLGKSTTRWLPEL